MLSFAVEYCRKILAKNAVKKCCRNLLAKKTVVKKCCRKRLSYKKYDTIFRQHSTNFAKNFQAMRKMPSYIVEKNVVEFYCIKILSKNTGEK